MFALNEIKINCPKSPTYAAIAIAVEFTKDKIPVCIQYGLNNALTVDISPKPNNDFKISTTPAVCRFLARVCSSLNLYGVNALEKTEVDHWVEFSNRKYTISEMKLSLQELDESLSHVTYLVGHSPTLADICVWSMLFSNKHWHASVADGKALVNVLRWYNHLQKLDSFTIATKLFPETVEVVVKCKEEKSRKIEDIGKFVDLPDAKMGEVVVRFPPEASGFLHIGHAKAALLNAYYQNIFSGKLIMRFDDTNPEKEKEDFEKVILEDVAMLHIKPDIFTYTSDYFEVIMQKCEELLQKGVAYVDDTDAETMKLEREKKVESKNRMNDVKKNLSMWEEMKKGSTYGKQCCVRAKIDMQSDNGCLRDPTLYRCKAIAHPRTGNKFNVYPTYDFACPIVDSIEGVTHALRTTEYHDRDDQYFWVLDNLNLRKLHIYEYSRLNMTHTVLSKRKLTWFVEQGIVDGWDDPRMPTVRGVLRRGMTVEGLKQFIVAQGSSRSVVVMEWDKIWAFNKRIIDPIAPRYNAVEVEDRVLVLVQGAKSATLEVARHPKNPELGLKTINIGPRLFVDYIDAEAMRVGENVTFINWGNLLIKEIKRNADGKIETVMADLNTDNKDYKKTLKVTWVCDVEGVPLIPCACLYYDHLISKAVLGKDEEFKDFLNDNTKVCIMMEGDPDLALLKKGDIIQLQRKGFFICDEPYDNSTLRYISRESPVILISIPDGSKDVSILPRTVLSLRTTHESSKEALNQKKGKLAEKSPQEEKIFSPSCGDSVQVESPEFTDINMLDKQIKQQGDKIRVLKSQGVSKDQVKQEVNVLLKLKQEYKSQTGNEWKPATEKQDAKVENKAVNNLSVASLGSDSEVKQLNEKIRMQGDKIRVLKSQNSTSKDQLKPEIDCLLKLKAEYKKLTGKEWKPVVEEQKSPKSDIKMECALDSEKVIVLNQQIKAQGDKIRKLKSENTSKDALQPEINMLLSLKTNFKNLTGKDWNPDIIEKSVQIASAKPPQNPSPSKRNKNTPEKVLNSKGINKDEDMDSSLKKITRLGLEAKKEENLADWYSQVITKAEMIEYYDISGCYILRPWAYGIWEAIVNFFDPAIKALGVSNSYFPMFVSPQALECEKTHIADFAPEVAWVTRSGTSELAEPIAIRPTSETVMYPSYAKWIRSHRDLPLKLNQWCSVVRWEFKHPQPFLRTREFLWQEGHTAFATKKEAVEEVHTILELYAKIYEHLLAIPVVRGQKTEKEKFAGADFTTTVEAYVSANGRAVQGATSHHLGQNFSKMFEIVFDDPETNEKCFAYQNSWGLTTRTIGVMVMVHGDNMGLVLPPHVAVYQVVVVPCGITANLSDADKVALIDKCRELESSLRDAGIRVKGDYRDNYSPGWKYNHWELKGVPIRIELGPRDVKKNEFVAVRRDTSEKKVLSLADGANLIKQLLDEIHGNMYAKAKAEMDKHMVVTVDWDDFCSKLDSKCIIQAPFCGEISCEDKIKKDSARNADELLEPGAPSMGAKGLCIPFQQPRDVTADLKCINPSCSRKPKYFTLFGRSY